MTAATTHFLTAIVVMLAAALCCGWATRAAGITQTSGELLAGVLLGPTLLGQVSPNLAHRLLPPPAMPSVGLLSLLIVLVYVAQTGSEIDPRVLTVRGGKPLLIVAGSTAIAVSSAMLIELAFGELVPRGVSAVAFTLFLAAALLITAVPVLARILDETGLTGSYIGGWALAIAVYVDFVAFTLAAVAIPLARAHLSLAVLEGPGILLATAGACWLLAPAIARLADRETRIVAEVTVLLLALAAASATNASTLVAAFMVGAILWRLGATGSNRITQPSAIVRALVPLYIVYSGLQVDLGALGRSHLVGAMGAVLVLAVAGKVLASLLAARLLGLSGRQARILAVLGNTRGLTELILISLGHTAGILSGRRVLGSVRDDAGHHCCHGDARAPRRAREPSRSPLVAEVTRCGYRKAGPVSISDLDFAHGLADVADAIALEALRRGTFGVREKVDGSVVTDVDIEIEATLAARIARAHKDDAVLGEELGTSRSARRTWIVDPIDGTLNFCRGISMFATLIALRTVRR